MIGGLILGPLAGLLAPVVEPRWNPTILLPISLGSCPLGCTTNTLFTMALLGISSVLAAAAGVAAVVALRRRDIPA